MKHLLRSAYLFTFLLLLSSSTGAVQKLKIYYVFDPLCSWCYGFSPVMEQIYKEYSDRIDFEVVPGGLVTGSMARPVKEGFPYIQEAVSIVENDTEAKFGKAFNKLIDDGSYIYNSEPPCLALTIVKELKAEVQFPFAHDLHKLIFIQGKNLNDQSSYGQLLEKYDIDSAAFFSYYNDPDYKKNMHHQFDMAYNLGASGFPALVLVQDNKTRLLTSGYQDYTTVKKKLDKALKKYK